MAEQALGRREVRVLTISVQLDDDEASAFEELLRLVLCDGQGDAHRGACLLPYDLTRSDARQIEADGGRQAVRQVEDLLRDQPWETREQVLRRFRALSGRVRARPRSVLSPPARLGLWLTGATVGVFGALLTSTTSLLFTVMYLLSSTEESLGSRGEGAGWTRTEAGFLALGSVVGLTMLVALTVVSVLGCRRAWQAWT